MARHGGMMALLLPMATLLLLLLVGKSQAVPAAHPIYQGYHGWARCTGDLNVRNSIGGAVHMVCKTGKMAYVQGTIGSLYALLPGWGLLDVDGRKYGVADHRWLETCDEMLSEYVVKCLDGEVRMLPGRRRFKY